MSNFNYISNLGLVASHKRKIRNGYEYDSLFPKPDRTDPLLNPGASVFKTLDLMADIVKKTKSDTAKIAPKLQGKNLAETCHNIWDFCYNYFQYEQDSPGEEQLRRPARSWADRAKGIDCDCFSILVSSILVNLGIDHSLRICELNNKGYFQHVYVIVPVRNGKYITIDPVLNSFNTEAPGITKTHDKMIPVRYLNGLGNPGTDTTDQFGSEFDGILGCACQSTHEVAQKFTQSVKDHLQNTRRIVGRNKCSLGGLYDDNGLLGALDFALANSHDDEMFLGALAQLAPYDDELMAPAMNGIYGELFGTDLGKLKFKKPGIFTKAAAAVQTVKNKVADSKVAATVKSKIQDVKKVAEKAGKAIIKVNPLVAAARAGLILAMEINLFGMADQLRWAYATPEQLNKYGVSQTDANKAKGVLAKVEKLFADKMQGKRENLRKAILSGKQAFNGLSGSLGEPVTAATGTAAASGFIAQIVSWIKQAGLKISAVAKANPKFTQKVSDRIVDKTFGPRPTTTISNNKVVDTGTDHAVPPDSGFPNSQEISQDLAPTETYPGQAQNQFIKTPTQQTFYNPNPEPNSFTEENSNEAPEVPPVVPPGGSNSKGGGTMIFVGLAAAAVALIALSGSGSSRKPAVNGLDGVKKAPIKRKTKRNVKRNTTKKTLILK